MVKEYPKCQICGEEMAEGLVLRRAKWGGKDLYLCERCHDLISAVVHDGAYDIFDDIRNVMGEVNETWKERLETWSYKEGEPK